MKVRAAGLELLAPLEAWHAHHDVGPRRCARVRFLRSTAQHGILEELDLP